MEQEFSSPLETGPEGLAINQQAYLDIFSHLSKIIAQTTNLRDLVCAAVEVIQTILQVDNCSIMLLNPEGTALTMQASTVISEELWRSISMPLGTGIAGSVMKTGRSIMGGRSDLRAEDAREIQTSSDPRSQKYRTDSFICVPLRFGKNILGVINITDRMDRRTLAASDQDMLEAIARLIASAVNNHFLWVRTRESREHMTRVLEGLPIGMFTITSSGHLTLCNKAARKVLELKIDEELDKSWEHYFIGSESSHIAKALTVLSRGESSFSTEFELKDKSGQVMRSVRLSALEAEELTPLDRRHILFLVEDLQQMRELWELRRSDQMKSTFLSIISHELRTPLASMKGAIHLLNQFFPQELREKTERLFSILNRNSDRLTRLVNNILDVMDLEGDNLTLYRKRTDLHELAGRIAKKFEVAEVEKKIIWNSEFSATTWELYVDEGRFGQVIEHLLENAVKFTPPQGTITINTFTQNGHWVLSVSNTGREINAENREKVFQRFYQVDGSLTRDSGGSGLGLYLCKEILRLHGAKIWVDSDFTGGVCLKIALPESNTLD
ncbi:TPA: hypothetical protein DDW35_09420 [Candidatus Sumerlaeota bacterium]|nr:hypothetical protein [Candidatus Sumerlaeota bacterium]